jgi:cell division septal protein FtsQ
MKKLRLGWITLAYSALGISLILALYSSRGYLLGQGREVDIRVLLEGADPLVLADLQGRVDRALRVSGKAKSFSDDLPALASVVQRIPWVDTVRIQRHFFSRVVVEVQTKTPVLGYVSDSGEVHMLSADGTVFPPQRSLVDAVIALTRESSLFTKLEERSQVLDMIAQIPSQGSFSKATIADIHRGSRGQILFTLRSRGGEVHLGRQQIGVRSARVSQVLDYLQGEPLDEKVIDADYAKKVLVSPKRRR